MESKLLHKWNEAVLQNSACSFAETKLLCVDERNKKAFLLQPSVTGKQMFFISVYKLS